MQQFNYQPEHIHKIDYYYNQFLNQNRVSFDSNKLIFSEMDSKDIYNITSPFIFLGKTIIAGRVERRDSEYSKINFFELVDNHCHLIKDAPEFNLQDPFYCTIHGEFILGGVYVSPSEADPNRLEWATHFYKGSSIYDLKLFFKGPLGMKDIRLCEINANKIAVLTRPQGIKGGRGKIGYTEITHINELTLDVIEHAELLSHQFHEENWGGANTVHLLENGNLGVLGHIASFDDMGNRHYYPMTFEINFNNRTYSELKIIAERSQLLDGPSKREDLKDVLFPGGIILESEMARLYLGVSDCEAHWIDIKNPFK